MLYDQMVKGNGGSITLHLNPDIQRQRKGIAVCLSSADRMQLGNINDDREYDEKESDKVARFRVGNTVCLAPLEIHHLKRLEGMFCSRTTLSWVTCRGLRGSGYRPATSITSSAMGELSSRNSVGQAWHVQPKLTPRLFVCCKKPTAQSARYGNAIF